MFKIQQLNQPPSDAEPQGRASVIDAEVVREEGITLKLAAAPPSEPAPDPGLFSLPPELDPKQIMAQQRARLDQMMATLEGRDEPVATTTATTAAPEPETPEQFLERAMALLDGHLQAMEGTLERIAGRRWTKGEKA